MIVNRLKLVMETLVAPTQCNNRLKLVMETLVAPTQCNFVPGRQITDNIIIVQEMLHTMRRKSRTGYMAIKVDLEKA